jgi:tight adherence protein C
MNWHFLFHPAPLLIAFAVTSVALAALAVSVWRSVARHVRLGQRAALAAQGLVRLPGKSHARRIPRRAASRLAGRALPHGEALEIARRLEKFGVPVEYANTVFTALRIVAALALFALFAAFALSRGMGPGPLQWLGIAVGGGGFGWFLPQLLVSRLIARRMRAIELGLPEAIELLVIAVEAGLALEDAVDRIVPELRLSQSVLAEELALTSADLKILPNRDAALRRLAERVTVASVHSVVATLSQTMRYGTPLAQALRVVAAELRNDSLLRLEEKANKAPVLLTVPMIIFILPAIFMVIGGPTALRLIDTFFHTPLR